MDDLISRQAAIDDIKAIYEYHDTVTEDRIIDHLKRLPSADVTDTNVGDINKFIDSLEEIFADLRERHGDDSVCGLCEYDGAYIGQSGNWCNECPGFDRDDCFKLSDECRRRWIDTVTKSLPSAQPEPRWIPWGSGNFPKESGTYTVTAYDGATKRVTYAKYQKRLKRWELTGARAYWRVLAWMPLPEPYKDGEQDG